MDNRRQKAEELIYKVLDTADKTKTNSDYYKKIFAKMTDDQFYNFFKNRLPLRFHMDVFNIEPKMYDIVDAFKVLNKPLFEKVKMPHVFIDKNGNSVESKEALVIYINIKRMKQMNTKKTTNAININKRDYKTGLLTSEDKGGKETGREFETLAIAGLDNTMNEFARPKADAMSAMSQMSNEINSKGFVRYSDLEISKTDSLGKNALYIYLMGAHIHSNLIDINYMTPYTAKNKQNNIERK
jgi:hypothetical protein